MTVTESVRLGPRETRLLFGLEARGFPIFTLDDAVELAGVPRSAAAALVHRLRRKGRVVEVRKGAYLLVPARAGVPGAWSEDIYRIVDALLAGRYYVGFWSAMNYWGMTEEIPRVVHVVVPSRRRAFEFQGQRVEFVSQDPRRIFGFVSEPRGDGAFNVSDREKTILDGLRFPQYAGGVGEVAKGIWRARRSLRWTRLEEYVRRLGVDAVRRRLGYLLEVLGLAAATRDRLRREFRGFRWLDPSAPKDRLGYSHEWGLALNLSKEDVLGGKRP